MTSTAENLLRLTHCPRCGYDLEGLPREHVCPECEYAYDETMSMIWVWGVAEEPKIFNVVFYGFLVALLSLGALFLLSMSFGNRAFMAWLCIVVLGSGSFGTFKIFIKTIQNYRFRKEEKTADALLFEPRGYVVSREGAGALKSWDTVKRCTLQKLKNGRWELRIKSNLWNILREESRDFIIKATPREAAAIRGRIRRHIAEAKK